MIRVPEILYLSSIEMGDSRKSKSVLEDLLDHRVPRKRRLNSTVNSGVVVEGGTLANWIKTDAPRDSRQQRRRGGRQGAGSSAFPQRCRRRKAARRTRRRRIPDASRRYGAVGFLRPSHLVAEMIAQFNERALHEPESSGLPPKSARVVDSSSPCAE